MKILLKHAALLVAGNETQKMDVLLDEGVIQRIKPELSQEDAQCIDLAGRLLVPGFIDPHVHLREPGFTHKETIRTGARAAIAGGYTTIFAMPNVSPCPDTAQRMLKMRERSLKEAGIAVGFYAPITKGECGEELTDFDELKEAGAVGFSDDGKGVQDSAMMYEAMKEVARLDGVLAAHCEEERLLFGGCIHAGDYAQAKGYRGILRAVEDQQIARDLLLAHETGARYHICHMSTHRGVDLLKLAKEWGAKVSGEVTPHHLLLCDEDLREDGRWKMNPPLRSKKDQKRLLEGLQEGIIEAIATDHAPHTEEEKSRGLEDSPFGITGLETSFPLLYTHLVLPGHLTLSRLVDAMSTAPARIFSLEGGRLSLGAKADLAVIDLNARYTIDPKNHQSMGKNTPFAGWEVQGRVDWVFKDGIPLMQEGSIQPWNE
ncbi:Dihydroorotase [Clostridiaceae bacterium JG1575]|nr:Dihydroorotase [Clostridiaceae bacterium JG1575]